MDRIRILAANEPRSYREVLAAALPALRPRCQVTAVEPDDLDAAVERLRPHLVVCSQLTGFAQLPSLAWVLLYPDGKPQSVVGMNGHGRVVAHIEFADLLAIVDRLTQAGGADSLARWAAMDREHDGERAG